MDDHMAGGGPGALPESPRADPIAGELVTETLGYDGGRGVTVYVPPDPPEAVVFAGDGQGISRWGGFLEAAGVPSTMIVGVHGLADETPRLQEYSPVFDTERFAAHERFFVTDVGRWVWARFGVALPAERTAIFGASAGGELALALGLRHPDVYGAVFCGSPGGGYQPAGVLPPRIPRTYLVAGTLEPFFLGNATRWAAALREAGADVVLSERVASHGSALWRAEFPLMVAWAFGRRRLPLGGRNRATADAAAYTGHGRMPVARRRPARTAMENARCRRSATAVTVWATALVTACCQATRGCASTNPCRGGRRASCCSRYGRGDSGTACYSAAKRT